MNFLPRLLQGKLGLNRAKVTVLPVRNKLALRITSNGKYTPNWKSRINAIRAASGQSRKCTTILNTQWYQYRVELRFAAQAYIRYKKTADIPLITRDIMTIAPGR